MTLGQTAASSSIEDHNQPDWIKIKALRDGHFYFASESVTEGHPDKLCDTISDAVLDACLEQDPNAKVACESVAKSNMILIAGEITTTANINIEQIVRERVKEVRKLS